MRWGHNLSSIIKVSAELSALEKDLWFIYKNDLFRTIEIFHYGQFCELKQKIWDKKSSGLWGNSLIFDIWPEKCKIWKNTKLASDKSCSWRRSAFRKKSTSFIGQSPLVTGYTPFVRKLFLLPLSPDVQFFYHSWEISAYFENFSWATRKPVIGDNGRMVKMMQLENISNKCSMSGNYRWIAGKSENLKVLKFQKMPLRHPEVFSCLVGTLNATIHKITWVILLSCNVGNSSIIRHCSGRSRCIVPRQGERFFFI